MVEQTVNDVLEYLRDRANIPLAQLGGDAEPIASNLEELVGVLGASKIDPVTLEPLGDEPEALDPLEAEPETESPDPLEAQPETETLDPLAVEPEPIASPQIEQKKDE